MKKRQPRLSSAKRKRTPPHIRARQHIMELMDHLSAEGGDRLPGERQLSARFDLSLNTIRKAIRQLVGEYRLATSPGDGHFICARRKTTDIGLILGEGQISTFVNGPVILAGILITLRRLGCDARILQVRDPADAAGIFEQYRIDGCLWITPQQSLLRSIAAASRTTSVPIVIATYDQPNLKIPDLPPLFGFDHHASGLNRAEFLLARGHRRIVYCSSQGGEFPEQSGYARALAAHGIPLDHDLLIQKPEDVPLRLPALLQAGGATAIISDGGPERMDLVFSVLEKHPWNEHGDLLIDFMGEQAHAELRRRFPHVRIAAINKTPDQEIGTRATEALIAGIQGRSSISGILCPPQIVPADQ